MQITKWKCTWILNKVQAQLIGKDNLNSYMRILLLANDNSLLYELEKSVTIMRAVGSHDSVCLWLRKVNFVCEKVFG